MTESNLDIVVAGTQEAVRMVESEAKELPEEVMLGAVRVGHRHFQPVIDAIISLPEKAATEPRDFALPQAAALAEARRGRTEGARRAAHATPRRQCRHPA